MFGFLLALFTRSSKIKCVAPLTEGSMKDITGMFKKRKNCKPIDIPPPPKPPTCYSSREEEQPNKENYGGYR